MYKIPGSNYLATLVSCQTQGLCSQRDISKHALSIVNDSPAITSSNVKDCHSPMREEWAKKNPEANGDKSASGFIKPRHWGSRV